MCQRPDVAKPLVAELSIKIVLQMPREAGAQITDRSGFQFNLNSAETVAVTPGIAAQVVALIESA